MQISSTARTQTAALTKPTQQPKTETQQVHRPLSESWTVGEDTYSSTEELLADIGDLQNVKATYSYQKEESPADFSHADRVKNAVGKGLLMAAGGAAMGVGGTFLLGAVATAGQLATSFAGGRPDPVSTLALLSPIFIGGAIGAGVGGVTGYQEQVKSNIQSVPGLLTVQSGKASFYPKGKVDGKVDLNAYQASTTPDPEPAVVHEGSYRDNLKGAAVASGLGLVSLTGLTFFVPPVVGYQLGAALDDRTALGRGVGLVAGAGLTAAMWGAASNGHLLPALGIAAVAGAVGGGVITKALESKPAQRAYGKQWWTENTPKPSQPGI